MIIFCSSIDFSMHALVGIMVLGISVFVIILFLRSICLSYNMIFFGYY